MNCFSTKITLFFHYFSLLHRLRQRIEQRPHLWICQHFCQKFRIDFIGNSCIIIFLLFVHLSIQILFLVERFLKKLCIFSSVIIQNIRIHIRNHIDLSMAGIPLYRFDVPTIQFQLISNTELSFIRPLVDHASADLCQIGSFIKSKIFYISIVSSYSGL